MASTEGAKVNVIDMGVVDLHLASVKPILVDRWENFFGQFEGDVDTDGFALGVRTNDADVQPTSLGAETVDCEGTCRGGGGLRQGGQRRKDKCRSGDESGLGEERAVAAGHDWIPPERR